MTEDAPERPLDLLRVLEVLARHRVQYLVIGGVAVQVHGHRRTTKDLDLVPSPEPDNIARLAAALEELQAQVRGTPGAAVPLPPTDPERLGDRKSTRLNSSHVRTSYAVFC